MLKAAIASVVGVTLAALVAAFPVAAETRLAAFGTPGAAGIEVNPRTNKAYVGTGSGLAIIDSATHTLKNVESGAPVLGAAVNPRTNRIYAVRGPDGPGPASLIVIDGDTDNVTARIALPASGSFIAVNPVTDEAYVSMPGANQVAIIDGASSALSIVPVAGGPAWLAVNPVTNRVYVSTSGNLYAIEGATKVATMLAPGVAAGMVAVNPVTDKIYATDGAGAGIVVVDGGTGAVGLVPTGDGTTGIVVNPATNRIYVASTGSTCCSAGGEVTVIDGATNATSTVGAGVVRYPIGLALNPVTNTIYVRSGAPGNAEVVVIDGATNATHTFEAAGFFPGTSSQAGGLAVNPVTNLVYVGSSMVGVAVFDGSRATISTVALPGPVPSAGRVLAASPTTEKVYIAQPHGVVTVLDEANNATTDVVVGAGPMSIAVNYATNRIYVANRDSSSVSVIDGATNAVTTVPVGVQPTQVAANTVSNQVYVLAGSGAAMRVIDGSSNTVSTVPVAGASALAVDEAANRLYVGMPSGGVTVLEGSTFAVVATVPFDGPVYAVDVNPVTRKFYVGTSSNLPGSGRLFVVDGSSYTSRLIHEDRLYAPTRIVVNPLTNKLYTAWSYAGGVVRVIDGATDMVVQAVGTNGGGSISIDRVANKAYVANFHELQVIDGANETVSKVPLPSYSYPAEVSPVTHRVYLSAMGESNLLVVRTSEQRLANHDTDVTMAGGNVTSAASPALSLAVCCAYAPTDPAVDKVYYRVGHANGAFTAATGSGPYSATLSGLQPGLNFVTLFATDAMQGTSIVAAQGSLSMIGAPRVFAFTYAPPSFGAPAPLAPGAMGSAYSRQLPLSGGIAPFTFTLVEGRLPSGLALSASGLISGTPTEDGFFAFTVSVTDAAGTTVSQVFTLTTASSDAPRLGNISTRALASTGQDVVIGGFVIGGSGNKTVVVRARGPSLTAFGVTGALANPTLQLVRSSDQATVASNDDWGNAVNAAVIAASGYAPADALESAILVNLPPGAYTAIVTGAGGSSGVAIVEVFELDHPEIPLANISTRAQVQSGGNVLIGGFVVQGSAPQTVVIRARGPSLAAFGISGALSNPGLTLFRSSDQVAIAANDNWMGAPNAADIQASGFAPASTLESAILVALQPGAYTAVVNSVDGPPGVGIVEVFAIP